MLITCTTLLTIMVPKSSFLTASINTILKRVKTHHALSVITSIEEMVTTIASWIDVVEHRELPGLEKVFGGQGMGCMMDKGQ